MYMFWLNMQPDLDIAEYDFTFYDQMLQAMLVDMHVLANLAAVPAVLMMNNPPTPAISARLSWRRYILPTRVDRILSLKPLRCVERLWSRS